MGTTMPSNPSQLHCLFGCITRSQMELLNHHQRMQITNRLINWRDLLIHKIEPWNYTITMYFILKPKSLVTSRYSAQPHISVHDDDIIFFGCGINSQTSSLIITSWWMQITDRVLDWMWDAKLLSCHGKYSVGMHCVFVRHLYMQKLCFFLDPIEKPPFKDILYTHA